MASVRITLCDDWHQDEPLAFLVKNHDTTFGEYTVFAYVGDAESHAEIQEQAADDAGDEAQEWEIWPLYASNPLSERQARQYQ